MRRRFFLAFFVLSIVATLAWFVSLQAAEVTLTAGSTGDQFGYSVAIDYPYAVVGAWYDDDNGGNSGSAYIFYYNGTSWAQQAQRTGGAGGDHFGRSVSISGDYALVGAPDEDGGGTDRGAAYLYYRNQGGANVWGQHSKFTASDAADGDTFGRSVSIEGDYAVVGAPNEDGGTKWGAAYVFEKGGGWSSSMTENQKLTASDGASYDYFGTSVDLHNNDLVVGASGEGSNEGAAYVFSRGATTWAEQGKLTASDGASSDELGYSVSICDKWVVAGAWKDNSSQGAAYVFEKGAGWSTTTETAKLTAGDGGASDLFGSSVSVSGNRMLVGAPGDNSNRGSVYPFLRTGGSWVQKPKQIASDGAASDEFGHSVSICPDLGHAIVGAQLHDIPLNADQGQAYVYLCKADLALPVELSLFAATADDDQVTLQWITESEVDNLGFNLYRAEEREGVIGEYLQINDHLIPGEVNTSIRMAYEFVDRRIDHAGIYWYRLEDVDLDGIKTLHDPISVTVALQVPMVYTLHPNYPNPFNPVTTLAYDLPEASDVILSIYAVSGQWVATLVSGYRNAGHYEVVWDGSRFADGVYLYHLQTGGFVETKRMLLLK
jgi:hypothetical protein